MAGNPRVVIRDIPLTWDGVSQRLPRGQVMDVTPGSALEAAIGRDNLVPLRRPAVQPPAEEPEPQEKTVPAKARAAAKKAGDDKDGDS
jgi:hypothetical protein